MFFILTGAVLLALTSGYAEYENEIQAQKYVCMRDRSDRLPKNLAEVLEDPKAYIGGPNSQQKKKREKIVIIGGGIAGLTAAYLLLNVGHQVTILEGQNRIGGRIYTHYGNGYIANLGAMRIPLCHRVVMKALQIFNIPSVPISDGVEKPGNYYFINGKYITEENIYSQKGLRDLYTTFEIPQSEFPRDDKGKIRKPQDIVRDFMDNEFYDREHCKHDESLSSFIREKLYDKGYNVKIADVWATVGAISGLMMSSIDNFLNDAVSEELHKECKGRIEIVNGTSVLPEQVLQELMKFPDFKVIKNAKVHTVSDENNRVSVYYGDLENSKLIEADWVLITATAGAVDLINFTSPLPFWKKFSLQNLKYVNSVKIFLKFKTPFWTKKENNLAEPIVLGKLPISNQNNSSIWNNSKENTQKTGAIGKTDGVLKQIYYPYFDFNGPVLLAGYTWDSDADLFVSLSDSAIQEVALKELSEIHGNVVREEFEEIIVKKWIQDEFSHGAFVFQEPYQKYSYMDDLRKPYGNVYFSGEYTNKEYNGWIESAMESSIRVLVNKSPNRYDEKFLEEEIKFLERNEK